MVENSRIEIGGETVYFNITRKKIKNMYMRFSEDGVLQITVPNRMDISRVDEFIRSKIKWILHQKKQMEKLSGLTETKDFNDGDEVYFLGEKYDLSVVADKKNFIEFDGSCIEIRVKEKFVDNAVYKKKLYEEWLRVQCLCLCADYVEEYSEKMKQYGVPAPRVGVKSFKARWGCCIPKRNQVEFAINLVKAPKECVEYVVVHELAHFKFIHHDEKFYNFVSMYIPDWKKRRDLLNRVYGRVIS